mgnify:CR=1 FL=1
MAGITLAQAEARRADWLAADEAISDRGQSYTIGDRRLDRANLAEVREAIRFWHDMVIRLSRGGGRVRLATPV